MELVHGDQAGNLPTAVRDCITLAAATIHGKTGQVWLKLQGQGAYGTRGPAPGMWQGAAP